jgi:hypothetical protein
MSIRTWDACALRYANITRRRIENLITEPDIVLLTNSI